MPSRPVDASYSTLESADGLYGGVSNVDHPHRPRAARKTGKAAVVERFGSLSLSTGASERGPDHTHPFVEEPWLRRAGFR